MSKLTGKTAIVTGASRGIGAAIARRFAEEGANIVVNYSGSQDKAEAVVAEIEQAGGKAIAVKANVADADAVKVMADTAMKEFGSIDILVNNAGSLAGSDNFLSTTPEQWKLSFDINLLGPMMLAQGAIPHMRNVGGGRIINIGSTGSLGAEPGFGAYTAMKHGLVGLSKTLAAEFGPDGILCNTVCPGYIATDMHMAANIRLAEERGIAVAEMKKQRYAHVALRDAGLPEDVANAVAYLAGPQGKYVTGINLPVTGGVPFGI